MEVEVEGGCDDLLTRLRRGERRRGGVGWGGLGVVGGWQSAFRVLGGQLLKLIMYAMAAVTNRRG